LKKIGKHFISNHYRIIQAIEIHKNTRNISVTVILIAEGHYVQDHKKFKYLYIHKFCQTQWTRYNSNLEVFMTRWSLSVCHNYI